jgi:plastocyanin
VKRFLLATAVLVVAFAAAGQARAAEYKVFLGEQAPCGFAKIPGCPAGVPKGTTLDDFFPGRVTIVAGDTVTFSSAIFHTVTYAPKRPDQVVPDPAKGKYAELKDAAGDPFYFMGLSKLIYNGLAFAPFGPKAISGSTPASSGALSPQGNGPNAKPATFTFTFPKAGTYKLLCTVHPGMTGTVVVKPAGTAAPLTPTQVSAAALQQVNAGWAKAKVEAAAAKPPAKTVYMGIGSDAAILGYFPSKLSVKAGTTVTFVNRSTSEPHNIVFGPKKYIEHLQKTTDLMPTGPTAPNQVSPFASVGSDPKSAYSYDGTNHGNGFFSPPVTVGPKGSVGGGLGHSYRVKFTKPGKYKYFCWIHGPDMKGEIDVTP